MRKYFKVGADGSVDAIENPGLCGFGISEAIGALIATGIGAAGVGAATAGTIGGIAGSGITGALLGGGLSALTGGSFGKGALMGGALGLGQGALGQLFGQVPGMLTSSGATPSGAAPAAAGDGWSSGTTATGQSVGGGGIPGAGPQSDVGAAIAKGLHGSSGTLALLAALGSRLSAPNTQAQPPASFSWNYNPSGYINRAPVQFNPNTNWQEYGYGPEQQFFTGNQLGNLGAPGHAQGGVISRHVFSTGGGHGHVQGDGGGQDDNVNAKLSPDEFVMDASTVARLGDGSSREGARRMEMIREAIAHDAGSKRVVQKKVKGPLSYVNEARGR